MENSDLKSLYLVMTVQPEEKLVSLCNRWRPKSCWCRKMRSDGCNFRVFYGIWNAGLQGSWSILYLLLEQAKWLKHADTQTCSSGTQVSLPGSEEHHNETVKGNSHEKGTPYATRISSTKCFSLFLILLRVWALKKKKSIKQKKTNKETNKKSTKSFLLLIPRENFWWHFYLKNSQDTVSASAFSSWCPMSNNSSPFSGSNITP